MAYYVDTGDGFFTPCHTIAEAREVAQHALDRARDFRRRMGWTPFWGRCVEIRKGPRGLPSGMWRHGCEAKNQRIVAATKTHDIMHLRD